MRKVACLLILVLALPCKGASYATRNFVVEAPTQLLAKQCAETAEQARTYYASIWLGRTLPDWPQPCPVKVTVTNGGSGGATSFAFDRNGVAGMSMHVEGTTDRILVSVLPHEVTHTVLNTFTGAPIPRWADEGMAVCSEDASELDRHDKGCRQVLNTPGRMIPLRRLFSLRQYPSDIMALYVEGFSVTHWLIEKGGRGTFLNFLLSGAYKDGWDVAVQRYYGFDKVEGLEQAWMGYLKETKGQTVSVTAPGVPASQQSRGTGQSGAVDPRVKAGSPGTAAVLIEAGAVDDRLLQAVTRIEQKVDTIRGDLEALKQGLIKTQDDVSDLQKRVTALEQRCPCKDQTSLPGAVAPTTRAQATAPGQGWYDPPQRVRGQTTYPQPYTAQPFLATPSPYCPPGGT